MKELNLCFILIEIQPKLLLFCLVLTRFRFENCCVQSNKKRLEQVTDMTDFVYLPQGYQAEGWL
ncbi:hypothetical protein BpHYR1_010617 [Brachionus plicatilis]|uniref:Uncharacterized protein n=1 Tax=Brachionus plicatilis TaxID=10195 RepID=A0A3M7S773_BRAPC|nr:hypothetical protein BpHYR1_010617 [Brachionus plicatilis]